MRKYLVAKLSGGIYLYTEDEWVRRVIIATQWNHGKENLRVMRVTDTDVDVRKELTSPAVAQPSADAPSDKAAAQPSQPEAAHPQTTAHPPSTPQTADRPPPTSMPSRTQPP